MNATQKQNLVSAVADFFMLAEELGSTTKFPDAAFFADHPQLTASYKRMMQVARHAGWCDDSFVEELARDVTTELRRKKRAARRGSFIGLQNISPMKQRSFFV